LNGERQHLAAAERDDEMTGSCWSALADLFAVMRAWVPFSVCLSHSATSMCPLLYVQSWRTVGQLTDNPRLQYGGPSFLIARLARDAVRTTLRCAEYQLTVLTSKRVETKAIS